MRAAVTVGWGLMMAMLVGGCLAPAATSGATAGATTGATDGGGEAEAGADRIAFGELRLVAADGAAPVVFIHADGGVERGDEMIASLGTDGRMVMHHTGEVVLELDAAGALHDAAGTAVARMASDGTLTIGDQTMTIGADGAVLGGDPAAVPVTIEGATTDGQRRTAMLVLLALRLAPPATAP